MSLPMRASTIAPALLALLLVACADPPRASEPSGDGAAELPSVALIECLADGSTSVRTPRVLVQRDGVHVRVVSHLDEPASINGWGFDVDQGESRQISPAAPGTVETACWPFSQHDSGREPPTHPVQVLDPDGAYFDGEVQCSGQAMSWVADYFTAPDRDAGRIPLEVARVSLRGLEADDEVRYAGYTSADNPPVVVVRDSAVVASIGFARFDGDWSSPGGTICADSGIHIARGM